MERDSLPMATLLHRMGSCSTFSCVCLCTRALVTLNDATLNKNKTVKLSVRFFPHRSRLLDSVLRACGKRYENTSLWIFCNVCDREVVVSLSIRWIHNNNSNKCHNSYYNSQSKWREHATKKKPTKRNGALFYGIWHMRW